MASRVHLPDDHNHTTECFKRVATPTPSCSGACHQGRQTCPHPEHCVGVPDTVSIVDWEAFGHRVVLHLCIAVLSGMAAVRIWGASC